MARLSSRYEERYHVRNEEWYNNKMRDKREVPLVYVSPAVLDRFEARPFSGDDIFKSKFHSSSSLSRIEIEIERERDGEEMSDLQKIAVNKEDSE